MGAPQPDIRKLPLPPGLMANGTFYDQANRWCDGNLMRFVRGYVGPIGGWTRLQEFIGTSQSTQYIDLVGRPCGALAYRASNNQAWLIMGTNSKIYAYRSGNKYDITPSGFVAGNANATPGAGYGDGGYGDGGYGIGLSAFGEVIEAGTWSLDTYGDWLIGVNDPTSRVMYSWMVTTPSTLMTSISTAPTCTSLVVTPEQHIFALGANGSYQTVKWNSAGEINNWVISTTTTAGEYQLMTNGRLMAGIRLRNETLLFTDADVHSATYTNDDFIYRFTQVGVGCGLVSKRSVVSIDGRAIWMSHAGFFVYDGFVSPLPCEVWDKVFSNLDPIQKSKTWAVQNSAFNEVTWFYPVSNDDAGTDFAECSRYVTYNYVEQTWTYGAIDRAAGVDAGAVNKPIWMSTNGYVWQQESGQSRFGADGIEQLVPYISSGPLEIEDGGNVARVHTFIPDERRPDDDVGAPLYNSRVQYKLYAAFYPNEAEFGDAQTFYTNGPTSVRRTGRWFRLNITERTPNSDWLVGVPRVGVTMLGRR